MSSDYGSEENPSSALDSDNDDGNQEYGGDNGDARSNAPYGENLRVCGSLFSLEGVMPNDSVVFRMISRLPLQETSSLWEVSP